MFSVAGFSFGAQVKVAGSISGNFSKGFKLQAGGAGSVSTGINNVTLKDSNSSLLSKAGSIVSGLFTDTGATATAEAGAFVGTKENPADVENLGREAVEIGGSLSKKGLTKGFKDGLLKDALNFAPSGHGSGQLVLGENGIKGLEIGGGAGVGNPVLGGRGSASVDVNRTGVSVLVEEETGN